MLRMLIFQGSSLESSLAGRCSICSWRFLSESMTVFLPFCRYLCTPGAFYGLLNGAGFYHLEAAEEKCVR